MEIFSGLPSWVFFMANMKRMNDLLAANLETGEKVRKASFELERIKHVNAIGLEYLRAEIREEERQRINEETARRSAWPLTLSADQVRDRLLRSGGVPLLVTFAWQQSGTKEEKDRILRVETAVKNFMHECYRDSPRRVEFIDGLWNPNHRCDGASVSAVALELLNQPTLILNVQLIGPEVYVEFAYWIAGAGSVNLQPIPAAPFPLARLMQASARKRARLWNEHVEPVARQFGFDKSQLDQLLQKATWARNPDLQKLWQALEEKGVDPQAVGLAELYNPDAAAFMDGADGLALYLQLTLSAIIDGHNWTIHRIPPRFLDQLPRFAIDGDTQWMSALDEVVDYYATFYQEAKQHRPREAANALLDLGSTLFRVRRGKVDVIAQALAAVSAWSQDKGVPLLGQDVTRAAEIVTRYANRNDRSFVRQLGILFDCCGYEREGESLQAYADRLA